MLDMFPLRILNLIICQDLINKAQLIKYDSLKWGEQMCFSSYKFKVLYTTNNTQVYDFDFQKIITVKPVHAVTSIKQSHILKGHLIFCPCGHLY